MVVRHSGIGGDSCDECSFFRLKRLRGGFNIPDELSRYIVLNSQTPARGLMSGGLVGCQGVGSRTAKFSLVGGQTIAIENVSIANGLGIRRIIHEY